MNTSTEVSSISSNGSTYRKTPVEWYAALSSEEKESVLIHILREMLSKKPETSVFNLYSSENEFFGVLIPPKACLLPVNSLLEQLVDSVPDARMGPLKGVDLNDSVPMKEIIAELPGRKEAEAALQLSQEDKFVVVRSILQEAISIHPIGEPIPLEDENDKLIALILPRECCRLPLDEFHRKVSWWVPDARTGDLRGVDLEDTIPIAELKEQLRRRAEVEVNQVP